MVAVTSPQGLGCARAAHLLQRGLGSSPEDQSIRRNGRRRRRVEGGDAAARCRHRHRTDPVGDGGNRILRRRHVGVSQELRGDHRRGGHGDRPRVRGRLPRRDGVRQRQRGGSAAVWLLVLLHSGRSPAPLRNAERTSRGGARARRQPLVLRRGDLPQRLAPACRASPPCGRRGEDRNPRDRRRGGRRHRGCRGPKSVGREGRCRLTRRVGGRERRHRGARRVPGHDAARGGALGAPAPLRRGSPTLGSRPPLPVLVPGVAAERR